MTAAPASRTEPARPRRSRPRRMRRTIGLRLRMLLRSVSVRLSSSLTRRIVVLNLGGLFTLLVLFLYINQFREGLIDARVQSLQTQGEIIAAAIAASASVGTDTLTLDPEKLLQSPPAPAAPPAASGAPADEDPPSFEFSINPDRVGPVLRRLVSPTGTRARVYDRTGELVLDTRAMTLPAELEHRNRAIAQQAGRGVIEHVWADLKALLIRAPDPVADEAASGPRAGLPEVSDALGGDTRSIVRVNARGQTIVSMAVPIRSFKAVRGALLLSTQPGDIDKIIASDRWALFRVFLVAAAVMFALSLFLAGTIAGPIRRLAEAAERVRRGVEAREEIPDFTSRADEIGHLSRALRQMTRALYSRMEATEKFAADVAHELKNPLTSLRSAVETLPRVKTDDARGRLNAIIQHDIRRLDRLISDISDASRLDAELARNRTALIDVAALLRAVVTVANEVERDDGVSFALAAAPRPKGESATAGYVVEGHDSRLGQVIHNLIDNARSFSAEGGTVRVGVRMARVEEDEGEEGVEIVVDDDGPGVPAHAFERIFERFYTDRPNHGFGQNSGLGLSISRQIIEAHGGRIWAANRLQAGSEGEIELDRDGIDLDGRTILGARFTVWLPASRPRA